MTTQNEILSVSDMILDLSYRMDPERFNQFNRELDRLNQENGDGRPWTKLEQELTN